MPIKSFFSPQEQKQIVALRDSGCSIKKISTALRRSRPNITMFLNNPEEYKKLKQLAAEKSGKRKSRSKKALQPPILKKMSPKTPTKVQVQSKFKKAPIPGASSSTNGAKITSRDLTEFNKVILEHRCVIKFYTKLGERASSIYSNMKKVYSPMHPPLPAVQYWATQFRKGRQTILNDKHTVRKLTQFKNKKTSPNKKTTTTSIKKKVKNNKKPKVIKKVSKVAKAAEQEAAAEVVEEKSAPVEEPAKKATPKKLVETAKPFTIKLPGMDRLSKTLL